MAYQGSLFEITVPNGDSYSSINLLNAQVTQVSVPSATNVQVNITVDKFYWLSASSFGFYKNSFFVASFEDKISASTLTEIVIPSMSSSSTNTVDFLLTPREGGSVNAPVYGLSATYKIHDGDTILFRANEYDNAIIVCGVLPKYSQINYADIANTPTLSTVATSGSYADLTTKLSAGNNISFSGTNNLTINATDTKPSGYDTTGDKTDSVSSSATWSILSSVAITKGMWFVNYGANFPSLGSGNTGHRGVGVSDSSTVSTAPLVNMRLSTPCVTQDNYTSLASCGVYECTSNSKTLYLKVRQTSGQTLNVEGKLRVIKIL